MPREPPTPEEIEQRRQLAKTLVLPPGMLKAEYKRQKRQQLWEEGKEAYRRQKRQRKKAAERRQKELGLKPPKRFPPREQKPQTTGFVFDCAFDDLMNQREIVSLSNQIARAYLARRFCQYQVPLTIAHFDQRLKTRFENDLTDSHYWKGVEFSEKPIEELYDLAQVTYLTADTDEVIEELAPNHTYVIGGIVDKNRHKSLCVDKAQKLGIKVGRLPLDKYITINGRSVLATLHVFEICCRWIECRDWEKAFNEVLPPRRLHKGENGENGENGEETGETETGETETGEIGGDEDGEETNEADETNETETTQLGSNMVESKTEPNQKGGDQMEPTVAEPTVAEPTQAEPTQAEPTD